MGRVLVLGGSSYIGGHLYRKLGLESSLATYNSTPRPEMVHFDLASTDIAQVLEGQGEFTIAVLLLGVSKPDLCFDDPEGSRALNVERMSKLAQELAQRGMVVVFASTESVFDGNGGNYSEQDKPVPVLEYGRQKLAMEQWLQGSGIEHITVRIGRVYGSEPGDGTLFTTWLAQMDEGREIACAEDNVFSPIYVDDLVKCLLALIRQGQRGLYHLGGPEGLSRLDLLRTLIKHYERVRPFAGSIRVCRMGEFPLREARPLDISMNVQKLIQDTGVKPRTVNEGCALIVRKWFEDND